jgi:hypothetical protein
MENKNKNYTGIIICIVLAIGLVAFWFFPSKPKSPVDNALPPIVEQKPADNPVVATTTQTGKIDEHLTINNELRDVNFCGKTYKVKQVMIDGVDVVQRIAEITNKFNGGGEQDVLRAKSICGNIESGVTSNELKLEGPAIRNDKPEIISYSIGIGQFLALTIDYPSLEIKISKAEEGGFTVIGKLK